MSLPLVCTDGHRRRAYETAYVWVDSRPSPRIKLHLCMGLVSHIPPCWWLAQPQSARGKPGASLADPLHCVRRPLLLLCAAATNRKAFAQYVNSGGLWKRAGTQPTVPVPGEPPKDQAAAETPDAEVEAAKATLEAVQIDEAAVEQRLADTQRNRSQVGGLHLTIR